MLLAILCSEILVYVIFLLTQTLKRRHKYLIFTLSVLLAGLGGALLTTKVNTWVLSTWFLQRYLPSYDWYSLPLTTYWSFPIMIRLTWLHLRCPQGGFILEMWIHDLQLYTAQSGCHQIQYELGPIIFQTNWILFWISLVPAILAALFSAAVFTIIETIENSSSPAKPVQDNSAL
jgi:hypothetical protein